MLESRKKITTTKTLLTGLFLCLGITGSVMADTVSDGSIVEIEAVFTIQNRFGLVDGGDQRLPIPEGDFFFDVGDELSVTFSYRIGDESLLTPATAFSLLSGSQFKTGNINLPVRTDTGFLPFDPSVPGSGRFFTVRTPIDNFGSNFGRFDKEDAVALFARELLIPRSSRDAINIDSGNFVNGAFQSPGLAALTNDFLTEDFSQSSLFRLQLNDDGSGGSFAEDFQRFDGTLASLNVAVIAVPEPSCSVALVIACGITAVRRRRRRWN